MVTEYPGTDGTSFSLIQIQTWEKSFINSFLHRGNNFWSYIQSVVKLGLLMTQITLEHEILKQKSVHEI